MIKYYTFLVLIVTIMQNTNAQHESLSSLLPDTVYEWEKEGQDQYFKGEELFDFINGGAELYLSYSYKNMVHRDYSTPDKPSVMVDLFDMGMAKDAFGVYSHTRDKNDGLVGQGSQLYTGALIFWKNNYFVSITSAGSSKETEKAIIEAAKAMAAKIPGKGEKPGIIGLLPQDGLVDSKYTYFHHYIWQNAYFFISNDNIFNINDSTDAVIAGYDKGYLLLVKYPAAKKTKKAYKKAEKHMASNGHFLYTNGQYLIGIFNTDPEATANKRYESIINKINQP